MIKSLKQLYAQNASDIAYDLDDGVDHRQADVDLPAITDLDEIRERFSQAIIDKDEFVVQADSRLVPKSFDMSPYNVVFFINTRDGTDCSIVEFGVYNDVSQSPDSWEAVSSCHLFDDLQLSLEGYNTDLNGWIYD